MIERPRSPRWECSLPCALVHRETRWAGSTVNLSNSGLYVRLDEHPPEGFERGESVGVLLSLPDGELAGEAEVVWATSERWRSSRGPGYGVAVHLLGLAPRARERFERFIAGLRHVVLITDDDPDYAEAYQALGERYELVRRTTAAETLAELQQRPVSAIVLSDRLPDASCLSLLERIAHALPALKAPRIIASDSTMAGQLSTFVNVGHISGFLRKPFSAAELRAQLERAIDSYALAMRHEQLASELERANERLREENRYLRQRSVGARGFEAIVGNSPELLDMLRSLDRVRRSDATVHIHGETGTGKELVARALHEGGPRALGPFVAQNCAGIGDQLLQSTLFGHRRGAFTGAERDQEGVLQLASGGTLFLDEVAELSPTVQASLLRALQSGEIVPLGSDRPVAVNVRVVSATHKDLRHEVQERRFREDLFYRLMVIPVTLPPLRARRGDIPLLAMHFLDRHCERTGKNVRGFTPAAMRLLEQYAWPGNVRELDNEVERMVLLVDDGAKIPAELVSSRLRSTPSPDSAPPSRLRVPILASYEETLAEVQRQLLARALAESRGNVSRAAQALGMERSRLSKLRSQLGIPLPKEPADAD